MRIYKFLKIGLVVATLTPAVADAADIPRAPVYPASPLIPVFYDWTGLYLGGHIGAGWDGDGGFLGGGQAGFNYQFGRGLIGIEGQWSATSIKDTASANFVFPGFAVGFASAEARISWISTLAARAGWTFDRWLVYGKVGAAWAHVNVDALVGINPFVATVSTSRTISGWMLGLGAEYVLWDNWTGKVEYNMLDFGNDLTDSTVHVIKVGVNYRFRL
jgi:outer membrane immunogenic protein